MKRIISLLFFFASLACLLRCSSRQDQSVQQPTPAVYYWRTQFALSPFEQQFLRQHHIGKMYVRYFDVVLDNKNTITPNATLRFAQTPPKGLRIIPTIYIMEPVLRQPHDDLAEKIVHRVLQMNETHDIKGVNEVQLDCDWTERSRTTCFQLFEQVRQLLHARQMRLSATIRLHQLRMPPPPVDEGALMIYNTGNATKPNGTNPIIDHRDVMPYLTHLTHYDLPLCAAYPDYRWHRLFGAKGFKGIVYGDEIADTLLFRPRSATSYYAVASRFITTTIGSGRKGDLQVAVGDSVMVSDSPLAEIHTIQNAIATCRPSMHRQVILFPLDEINLKCRSTSDYEKIFHP